MAIKEAKKYFLFPLLFGIISSERVLAYDFAKDSGLNTTAQKTGHLSLPLTEPLGIIGVIIGVILSFVGVVFLLLTIYGGYLWMTASGNEEQVQKAKKIIRNSIIGLLIVFAAYAITAFVGSVLS